MRGTHWAALLLLVLLAWLQYRFWWGAGSSGEVVVLENQVAHQKRDNEGLQQRNDALGAEVEDLKSGEAAVEERARSELGMIRPGEKFYRVVDAQQGAPRVPVLEEVPGEAEAAAREAAGQTDDAASGVDDVDPAPLEPLR